MFLFTRLLKAAGAVNALHIALDGQDAIRLLSPIVEKSRLVVKPTAVFLDFKMPRVDGLTVLEWMRGQRELDDIPAIMMAANPDSQVISRATKLGAQCFLSKYPGKLTVNSARAREVRPLTLRTIYCAEPPPNQRTRDCEHIPASVPGHRRQQRQPLSARQDPGEEVSRRDRPRVPAK
jgi:CheY-like chemotaxis protein